ncbi:MAG: hypothetical protein CVT48_02380 [Thermoplasmata archaeon HGW-Thermoplasmata-1]|nr:MAG: hypothetical protein CVT48_02380 [Thermoplasmata archaeon HGW-Thermoplasmata-1]
MKNMKSVKSDPISGYLLGAGEIRALLAVAAGKKSICSLSEAAQLSAPRAYAIVAGLARKGFLTLEREGRTMKISLSDSRHAHSFLVLAVSREANLEITLRDSNMRILFSIMSIPKTRKRIAEEVRLSGESVRKYARRLMTAGMLREANGKIELSPSLPQLRKFLEDSADFINRRIALTLSKNAVVAWERGLEAIIRVPIDEEPDAPETALTAMARHGIDIMTDYGYYYIPPEKKLTVEDVALHTLLLDPNSVRYASYALLFLKKEGFERKYLLEKSGDYGIKRTATAMVEFLAGKEIEKHPLPSREEFADMCRLYGVNK